MNLIQRAVTLSFCACFFLLSLTMEKSAVAETYSFLKEFSTITFGSFLGPSDVSVAPGGNLYIAAPQGEPAILILDPFGNFISQFTTNIFFPNGIDLDDAGNLYYVTNFFDKVLKFSTASGFETQWGSSGGGNGRLNHPAGIDVGPDGSVYVADTDNHRIQKFDADGGFVKAWGSVGSGTPDDNFTVGAEFRFPRDVLIDPGDSLVLVADTGNDRVQGFTPNGDYLGAVGTSGSGGILEFSEPSGMAWGPNGIFVSDTGNNRIQGFFFDGTTQIFGNGILFSPKGMAVDNAGNLYVANELMDRITVFKPDIIKFEDGADSKTVNIPGALSLTFDVDINNYWLNVPSELFVWYDMTAGGTLSRFYFDGAWKPFGSETEMRPLVSGIAIPGDFSDLVWEVFPDTAQFPVSDLVFYICLDRNLDNVFNPADSVCDDVTVMLRN